LARREINGTWLSYRCFRGRRGFALDCHHDHDPDHDHDHDASHRKHHH